MSEYHVPVLLQECIEGLNIKKEGNYVDVTFGGGGHSREILKHIESGKLIGFDQDEDARANIPDDANFIFAQHNFKYIKHFLDYYDLIPVDGILADLGVSSHEFDVAERGFSFRFQGDLDMRMNQSSSFKASDIINTYDDESLCKIFREYGEIKNAWKLTQTIVSARKNGNITKIEELKETIAPCTPKHIENKYLAKVFQALRIEVNQEMSALEQMLEASLEVLKPGGRLVVITYHSLEDRMVKNFIKNGKISGKAEADLYGNTNVPIKAINRKVIIPSDKEIEMNSRARSAKLRIAEKL